MILDKHKRTPRQTPRLITTNLLSLRSNLTSLYLGNHTPHEPNVPRLYLSIALIGPKTDVSLSVNTARMGSLAVWKLFDLIGILNRVKLNETSILKERTKGGSLDLRLFSSNIRDSNSKDERSNGDIFCAT